MQRYWYSILEECTIPEKNVDGSFKVKDREKQVIETERPLLLEAINMIKKASPQVLRSVFYLPDSIPEQIYKWWIFEHFGCGHGGREFRYKHPFLAKNINSLTTDVASDSSNVLS